MVDTTCIKQILCFVDHASLYNLANIANLVHNSSQYVYFLSLHVSGNYVPIIRRNDCIYGTLRICHSVWMTVWCASCIPDSHPHRVTNMKCPIDIVISPDDGYIVARNMQRQEINILRRIVHQVGLIYKSYKTTKSHSKYCHSAHTLTRAVLPMQEEFWKPVFGMVVRPSIAFSFTYTDAK